ncbi:6-bladed beta-propeller [Longimicrobium sp.]|uniref:6-bladed beta-propeller n=1 Tax=Longimicrobium sp. TaxID=2029185 RepID=UPI002E311BB1|nr:6-bladed beta-propeller [Longimicrobium sp.]HEX6040775.1 6-bladed beta-propeller [Longimicrobium sp.]
MRHIFPLLLLAGVAACDARQADDAPAPAGQLVESSAPRWSEADAWHLDPEPDVTIGEAHGAPEHALAGVVGAARLSDDRIVIANFTTLDLRYFDARGRHIRTVGRRGNGPGEFQLIRGIGRAGDTVLVWDPFANRVSRFDARGSFAGSTSMRVPEMVLPNLIGFLDDGSLLVRHDPNADKVTREGEHTTSVVYLRFSGTTGREIATLGPYFGREQFRAVIDNSAMSQGVIFGNRSMVAIARAGVYRAESRRFQATLYAIDGTPVRTLRRAHTPVRATSRDVAIQRKALENYNEMVRNDPDLMAVQRRLAAKIPHRSTLPAISQVRVDRQDNLWMQAYVPPDAEFAEWSVFDPEGHWLGVVPVPANLEVLEIGDDYLLAKTVDPLDDVERVVLHRLRKPR